MGVNDPVRWNQHSFYGGYIIQPYEWPDMTAGRLFYKTPDGNRGWCSGTVINSQSQSTLITAAHCLNSGGDAPDVQAEGDSQYAGAWNHDFLFIPGYDATQPNAEPFGYFKASVLSVTHSWYWHGNMHDDVGFMRMGLNASHHTMVYEVGGMGYVFNEDNSKQRYTYLQGYPTNYNSGKQQRYADGYLNALVNDGPSKDGDGYQYEKYGDLGGGSSGGPWYTGNDIIYAVQSYRYRTSTNLMHASYMNNQAVNAFKLAQ